MTKEPAFRDRSWQNFWLCRKHLVHRWRHFPWLALSFAFATSSRPPLVFAVPRGGRYVGGGVEVWGDEPQDEAEAGYFLRRQVEVKKAYFRDHVSQGEADLLLRLYEKLGRRENGE